MSAGSNDSAKEDLTARLKKLINAAPCMLFMKGSPKEPRCGKDFLKFTFNMATRASGCFSELLGCVELHPNSVLHA